MTEPKIIDAVGFRALLDVSPAWFFELQFTDPQFPFPIAPTKENAHSRLTFGESWEYDIAVAYADRYREALHTRKMLYLKAQLPHLETLVLTGHYDELDAVTRTRIQDHIQLASAYLADNYPVPGHGTPEVKELRARLDQLIMEAKAY